MLPLLVEHAHLPTERVTGLAGAVERTASWSARRWPAGWSRWSAAPTRWSSTPRPSRSRRRARLVRPAAGAAEVGGGGRTCRGARRRTPAELRDGWSFMRRDPVLMGIAVMVAITNLLDQAWSVVLVPVWARDSGGGGAARAAVRDLRRRGGARLGGRGRLGRTAAALPDLPAGVHPRRGAAVRDARPRRPAVVDPGRRVVGGFASGFLNPVLGAVLFERIPAPLMGRVTSMNLAMSWSLMPFGGLLGGVAVAASACRRRCC